MTLSPERDSNTPRSHSWKLALCPGPGLLPPCVLGTWWEHVSDPEPPPAPNLYPKWGRGVVSSDYSRRDRSYLPRAWHEEGSTCDLDGLYDKLLS